MIPAIICITAKDLPKPVMPSTAYQPGQAAVFRFYHNQVFYCGLGPPYSPPGWKQFLRSKRHIDSGMLSGGALQRQPFLSSGKTLFMAAHCLKVGLNRHVCCCTVLQICRTIARLALQAIGDPGCRPWKIFWLAIVLSGSSSASSIWLVKFIPQRAGSCASTPCHRPFSCEA